MSDFTVGQAVRALLAYQVVDGVIVKRGWRRYLVEYGVSLHGKPVGHDAAWLSSRKIWLPSAPSSVASTCSHQ